MIVGFCASTQPTISAIALVKGSDRPLILASPLHPHQYLSPVRSNVLLDRAFAISSQLVCRFLLPFCVGLQISRPNHS
ncbi:hypothetical protein [Nostoc sp.]|uniref:hypothetical protein n=1 Tax=Nostoc sp. TaxID=1180 RepID=UPI002FFD51BF